MNIHSLLIFEEKQFSLYIKGMRWDFTIGSTTFKQLWLSIISHRIVVWLPFENKIMCWDIIRTLHHFHLALLKLKICLMWIMLITHIKLDPSHHMTYGRLCYSSQPPLYVLDPFSWVTNGEHSVWVHFLKYRNMVSHPCNKATIWCVRWDKVIEWCFLSTTTNWWDWLQSHTCHFTLLDFCRQIFPYR